MPLNRCEIDGKPGWKWGDAGTCYPYTAGDDASEAAAKKKALGQASAMGEFSGTGQNQRDDDVESVKAPIEIRQSDVAGVNFAQRLIEVIAVPYDEPTIVDFGGDPWNELFQRGAFDGIEKRPNRVRANRDHDDRRIIGKARKFWPSRQEGLVTEVRISHTVLGDETLALADDGILSASVGFAVKRAGQELDKVNRVRRIKEAYLDHIAFTPVPAYAGANVLSVRTPTIDVSLPNLDTPSLDELMAWYSAHKR